MASLIDLPSFARPGVLNAVIEISAGTNMKHAYDPQAGVIVPMMSDGKPRRIEFLPYPGNYGFIPSTFMDPAFGGDGHALDVFVLSEYVPVGTLMEVVPIAVLKLVDAGERDDKVISVPVDRSLRLFQADDLDELRRRFPRVLQLIEEWFTHYDATQPARALGWEDKASALDTVEQWRVAPLEVSDNI
jgi:inorganic pyrophosphatase